MSNENSTIINDIYNSRKQIIYYLDKAGYKNNLNIKLSTEYIF